MHVVHSVGFAFGGGFGYTYLICPKTFFPSTVGNVRSSRIFMNFGQIYNIEGVFKLENANKYPILSKKLSQLFGD